MQKWMNHDLPKFNFKNFCGPLFMQVSIVDLWLLAKPLTPLNILQILWQYNHYLVILLKNANKQTDKRRQNNNKCSGDNVLTRLKTFSEIKVSSGSV